MDPALVRALAADHETWATDDPWLLAIRERVGARRRTVLVVDAVLEVWWAERRAADPERAGAALAAHVSRAVAEARPGSGTSCSTAGFTPSTRTTPPAVRETAPTTGGRWVAYVPIEGDGSADPG